MQLPYSEHLIEHYQSLSHLPGFALLESGDKRYGRYDILSAYPYKEFKIKRDSKQIEQQLNEFLNLLPKHPSQCDLPFQGGAIGYISYDLGAYLAGIHSKPHPNLLTLPLLDMKFYDWAIISDHQLKQVHVWIGEENECTTSIVEEVLTLWNETLKDPAKTIQRASSFTPLIKKEEYRASLHRIHTSLKQGRAYQVNYTQPFIKSIQGDPWDIYHQIRQHNPVPYAAFLRDNDAQVISFSPEKFLSMEGAYLETSPIKGSAPRGLTSEDDELLQNNLTLSAKNRAENIMIVDLMRNDFGKIAYPGTVKVTALCELQSFSGVHHLVSHIQAQVLDTLCPWDVFLSCFPAGSITGAPKLESMRIIAEEEPFARGVYCGSIAYFSAHGRMDSSVAIRTMVAKADKLHLAAGGGIVIDSDWEDEYQECFIKIQGIVKGM